MLRPQAPRPVFQRASGLGLQRPAWVVALATLAGLASLPALSAVSFDFNPLNLKDPQSESMRTFADLAADPATTPHVIDVLAPSLEQADALAARLGGLDEVGAAITLSSFIPQAQEEKLELIDALAFYLGPALTTAVALEPPTAHERRQGWAELQSVLASEPAVGRGAARLAAAVGSFGPEPSDAALAELEARLTGTLPGLLDRLRQSLEAGSVELEDLPASLRGQWVNARGEARILVRPATVIEDNADLRAFAAAVHAIAPAATGTPVVVVAGGDEVVQAFREASLLALASIALVLALVLRDLRALIFVFAPLGLALLFTAASAVMLGLQLNFANVIVLPLLLGLGVSGTLLVVMRWREEGGVDRLAASSTPRAVLFSALTTVASFGSLAVSSHRGLASMGLLLTIALSWSLVCSLLILPHILALTRAPRRGKP
jgi:hopanoid biosynthesis associated RND transporter like protein HpnN